VLSKSGDEVAENEQSRHENKLILVVENPTLADTATTFVPQTNSESKSPL
jgi:hypothetical protein